MRIVPQVAPVSHCPFPPVLLLPAPRIAGLLPATTAPHTDPSDQYRPAPKFTFADPRLADVSPAVREALFEAAEMLLEVSLAFVLGHINDHALRAAQVLFHRQLTGHSPERPLTPVSFCAEMDADLLDIILAAKHRRTGAHTDQEVGYGA